MLYANASDILLYIVIASVALSLLLVLVLATLLIVVRSRHAALATHRLELTTRWRDIFKSAYTGATPPDPLPEIAAEDRFAVLELFAQFHELRPKDEPRAATIAPALNAIATKAGLGEYAHTLLNEGDDADKTLALITLGELGDGRAFEAAKDYWEAQSPELSRAAAECALRLDKKALASVLVLVSARADWVRSRVESMLREVAGPALDDAMARAIDSAHDGEKTRLLDYVRFCTPSAARVMCKKTLDASVDVETIAAALRSLAPIAMAADRDTALKYVHNTSPVVVISALRVLRKCAQKEDLNLLATLVTNPNHWVRLRAAEVVVQLAGGDDILDAYVSKLDDPYARDAIKQALAERKLLAVRPPTSDRRGAVKEGVPA